MEFEERRSKSAGQNFFSKRRMFGYIEITREQNEKLKDKSSREGFINNAAFRDFKLDLIAFFKDLSKKYFATHADFDYKKDQQEELSKLADAERQEHERDIQARKDFAKKLTILPKELDELENHYDNLVKKLETKSSQSQIVYDEIQSLLSDIEDCKVKIADYKLSKPARFKPTDLQKKNFHNYDKRYKTVVKHFDDSASLLKIVRDKLKVHELFKEFEAQNELYKNRLSNQFGGFESRLEAIFEKLNSEFAAYPPDQPHRFFH